MTFLDKLTSAVEKNNSLLCIGLDSERGKLPHHLGNHDDAQFAFNKAIIDATRDVVCSYKINSAFYEAEGTSGITQLKKTCDYLRLQFPDIPVILDAKRADIGNTNNGSVTFAFDWLAVDAITIHPYLGMEAVRPFLDRKDKGVFILCRTSNPGAGEFQDLEINGKMLYKIVAERVTEAWNYNGNCGLVVGATYPTEIKNVRHIIGSDLPLLIPGIGAQGGDIEQTVKAGVDSTGKRAIIHSARSIIFASSGEDFGQKAREEAIKLRDTINIYRKN